MWVNRLSGWLVFLLFPVVATATTITFEDGSCHCNGATSMAVPPKILSEGGNHFLRITGSAGDDDGLPQGMVDEKNRSTVNFTKPSYSMPFLTAANAAQSYQAKMRFWDNSGTDGSVFELFQDGPEKGGYGTKDGQGPVVRFFRSNGRVWGVANYANETKWDKFDLGTIPAGSWHTYGVHAVWSHVPSQGRIEILLDGVVRKRITGRDSNLGPTANRLPALKLGLYGAHATGKIDVDDVQFEAGSGGLDDPPLSLPPVLPPVVQLPPPRNFRVEQR